MPPDVRRRRAARRRGNARGRSAAPTTSPARGRRPTSRCPVPGACRRAAGATEYAAASLTPGRPIGEAVTDLMHRINSRLPLRQDRDHRDLHRRRRLRQARRACARTSPTSRWPACAATAWRRAMSAATSRRARRPARTRLVGADASHAWAAAWIPGRRVARVRPDQRPVGQRPLRHGRLGPRLRRRPAGQGRDLHRGEEVDPPGRGRRSAGVLTAVTPRSVSAASTSAFRWFA